MTRRRLVAAAALAALLLAAVVAYRAAAPRAPNVLWISIDSLRADRLPAYGWARGRTPYIDYLAQQGVVFEDAFTDSPWTTAAMASAMTGRFAVHHGLRTPFVSLPEGETTLAEILAARGWQTAAIAAVFTLDSVHRLDRGFDEYDDRYDSPIENAGERPHLPSALHPDVGGQRTYRARKVRHDSYRSDAAVGDAAVAWLQSNSRRRPFLLWVHFFGPHRLRQFGDDRTAAVTRALEPYDRSITGVDAEIGRILHELEASGRLGETIFVLQGDHGEDLLQHGELDHGRQLYDSVLRIPLIIAWPGRLAPRRVEGMARNVDILPTLLELLGIAPPSGLDGVGLAARLRGEPGDAPPLVAETLLSAEADFGFFNPDRSLAVPGVRRRALRTPRWKYIVSTPHPLINFGPEVVFRGDASAFAREELFDLDSDPGETRNLAAARPAVLDELRRSLRDVLPD